MGYQAGHQWPGRSWLRHGLVLGKGEEKAGSTNNHKVREALIKISFDAPEGTVRIQPTPTLSGWF